MKKFFTVLLGVTLTMATFLSACTMKNNEPSDDATDDVPSYVTEADSGEGYEHLLLDRKFTRGFGCSWNLGAIFTENDPFVKKGYVQYYHDIGKPIYVLPQGIATTGEGDGTYIKANGLEDDVSWEFEEGYKSDFVDPEGKGPFALQDFRLCVNSVVEENTSDSLVIKQYNDYLHENYPEKYPQSDPKLVKTINSNRNGKIVISYNSYNDISNAAYGYLPEFAQNTWPHLLLHQNFREDIDMAKFSSIEFSLTVKVNKAECINDWPKGESDRFDQPIPETPVVTSPETTLQTYFFVRSKKNLNLGAFIGVMLSSSNLSQKNDYLGIEQNGTDFFRVGLGSPAGENFDFEGDWVFPGEQTTMSMDLRKYIDYVLTTQFKNSEPNSKWYGVGIDDVVLSFFNIGYEYVGNWDCEYELSNLWARGILK